MTLGVFWGCQKNEIDLQPKQVQTPQTESDKTNAVSMDEAMQAYAEYLKRKPKDNGSLSVRSSDSEVLWDSAKSFNFSDTSGNLIAAPTDVYIKGEYKKAFFVRIRDTVRLVQVYVHPTDEYMKRHKGVVQMTDFDGLVGYKDDHDVLVGGYRVADGQIVAILKPKSNKPNNVGKEEPPFPNLLDGEAVITATRIGPSWSGYFVLQPVSSMSSGTGGGPSIGSGGGGGGGNGSSSSGSSGGNSGNGAYGEIVIPPYLFKGQNPADFLRDMGFLPPEVNYLIVKDRRIAIQVGEAVEALGLEASKFTTRAFTNLVRTNTPFKLANIASGYDVNTVLSLDKYLKAGFTGVEFAALWLNPSLFAEIDGFLNSNTFSSDAVYWVRTNQNTLNLLTNGEIGKLLGNNVLIQAVNTINYDGLTYQEKANKIKEFLNSINTNEVPNSTAVIAAFDARLNYNALIQNND
jgi:uncharacterized membrane protein YgcG